MVEGYFEEGLFDEEDAIGVKIMAKLSILKVEVVNADLSVFEAVVFALYLDCNSPVREPNP